MDNSKQIAFVLSSFQQGSRAFLVMVSVISRFEKYILKSFSISDPDTKEPLFGVLIKAEKEQMEGIIDSFRQIPTSKIKSIIFSEENN